MTTDLRQVLHLRALRQKLCRLLVSRNRARGHRRIRPAPDDHSGCRPRGGADLSRNRRRARPLPKFQGGRHGVWTDAFQVIGRDRSERQNITLRRRDGAGDALRSGPSHAGAFGEVVLAQGLGHANRQASRHEEGNRGLGTSASRDQASRMG
jgi:hypothetical protein